MKPLLKIGFVTLLAKKRKLSKLSERRWLQSLEMGTGS
jgi:hypothetical protein